MAFLLVAIIATRQCSHQWSFRVLLISDLYSVWLQQVQLGRLGYLKKQPVRCNVVPEAMQYDVVRSWSTDTSTCTEYSVNGEHNRDG
jgi:hypothetical protein